MPFPKTILLDSFNGCNLKCAFCDHKNISKSRANRTMGWGLYTKLIDEIARRSPTSRVWLIFFGEPTLLPDMPGRIAYAKAKGLKDVVLNSNGVALSKQTAKRYLDAGLDAIYVGIDAASPKTYEKIRIGGSYYSAVNNVMEYRKLARNRDKIYVQFVECDENRHEMDKFKTFWKSANVQVKIRPKVTWAGLVAPDKELHLPTRTACRWLLTSLSVCYNGDVALCPCDIHCRQRMGNVAKQSIEDVWKSYEDARRYARAGRIDMTPKLCHDCTDWAHARSEVV
jgi:radical SAM protein with 4Fe4S-binding SPASM domain